MKHSLRSVCTVACLGAALALAACVTTGTATGSRAPGDGTWVGTAKNRDFNDRNNWSPQAVPTATAVIPVGFEPPDSEAITFSQPGTTLDAILMQSKQTLKIDPGKTVRLNGQGIVICCERTQLEVYGELTGNLTLPEGQAWPNDGYVTGSGTVHGNIKIGSGVLIPGDAMVHPISPKYALTVFGTYEQGPKATLYIPAIFNFSRLEVRGTASLAGTVEIKMFDLALVGKPFKIVVADQGVRGQFTRLVVADEPGLVVEPKYNPNDVTVTVRRR
jgi:hypothetical protein